VGIFQGRRTLRYVFNSPITLVVLIIAVALLSRSVFDIYKRNQMATINRVDTDKKLSELEAKKDRLATEIEKLKTNRGVEEELRNKFQITKDGERVLVIVDETRPAGVVNTEVPVESPSPDGFIKRTLKYFGF
jgi:cell division protein FtsB